MKSFAVDRLGGTGIASLSGLDVHRRCLPDALAGRQAKLRMQINRNPPDQGLIEFTTARPRVLRLGEASLTVVGPLKEEIDKLKLEWAEWKAKQNDKKATSDLAAYLDKSVPNLSSIVVLMECNGKKILLTGDARGDCILDGLRDSSLMPAVKPLKIDVLKLPHHGSSRNVAASFLMPFMLTTMSLRVMAHMATPIAIPS